MKGGRTPISLALATCIALVSCSLQAEIILARPVFGWHTARSPFAKSSLLQQSPNLDQRSLNFVARSCRGGAALEEDEGEYDDEYDDEDEEETGVDSAGSSPTSAINTLVDRLASVSKAIMRAITAATQGVESEDEEEEISLVSKVVQTLKNMISAALDPEYDPNPDYQKKTTKSAKAPKVSQEAEPTTSDFGSYLSQAYAVADGRKDAEESPILGGSLNDALKVARSSARLLVVLIPSVAPNKSKKADSQAITSFLSAEVAKVAKKKARKKGETASFVLWSAKAGSSEATLAMKRLKVKATSSKGDKRPILLVAYAAQGMGTNGVPKVAPKVLAQHHCSPPPSAEAMAQWMNELRKRHSKQYATMQNEMREIELCMERKEGYKDSIQSDTERKIREKKEEEERLAKEKAEKERLEALEGRRAKFLEAMPEEPGFGARGVMILSVRHADGRNEKRKFAPDTQLEILFNWVDATFKMERELVVLTTMNGKQTFSWEDSSGEKTLKEAGLGRMVGFRVSEAKPKDEGDEAKEEDATKEEATKEEA